MWGPPLNLPRTFDAGTNDLLRLLVGSHRLKIMVGYNGCYLSSIEA